MLKWTSKEWAAFFDGAIDTLILSWKILIMLMLTAFLMVEIAGWDPNTFYDLFKVGVSK